MHFKSIIILKVWAKHFLSAKLFIFLLITHHVFAQNLKKENFTNYNFYTSQNGLYSEKINAIIQDSLGFLWLGTSDGLYRYDGNVFTSFADDKSHSKLLTSNILTLFKDKSNNLWIGCSNGLLFYSSKTGAFKEIEGLKESYIKGITQDQDGKIWLITPNNICILTKDLVVSKPTPLKLSASAVLFNPEIKNSAFIVLSNKIIEFETSTLKYIKETFYTNTIENYNDYSIIDSLGQIWIGRFNGDVIKFDSKTNEIKRVDFKSIFNNPSSRVTGIFCNSKQRVWFATDETGIVYYDCLSNKFEMFETPLQNNLPNYKATTFYIDQENNYWIGLEKFGMVMTNSYLNAFKFLENDPFGKNNIISAILKDSQGNLWVGTDGGGIFTFDKQNNLVNRFKNNPKVATSIANDAIQTIFEDSKKNIWVGSFKGGLSLYSKQNKSFTNFIVEEGKVNWLLRNDIRKIQEDNQGNLWLGIQGKGVSCYNILEKKFINFFSHNGLWTNDLLISKKGDIWVTTSNGVYRKRKSDKNFIEIDKERKFLKESYSNCLYESSKGEILIGTLHGLYYYNEKNNQCFKIEIEPLLAVSSVRSINQDQAGNYFIGTNNGLFRYNNTINNVDHFGMGDGLIDQTFTINSTYRNDNILYFGTSNGFFWFDAATVRNVRRKSKIYITNIKINNVSIKNDTSNKIKNSIELVTKLELDYKENYLTIDFSFPSYIVPSSNINFEFKLEGRDNHWQSTNGQKSITFTSIPPGKYILNIREATSSFYQENDNVLKLELVIRPPFYQTWWFRTLIIFLLIVIILLYLNFKTKQLQKRNQLLELKIEERTAEIKNQNEILEKQSKELRVANSTKDKLFSIIAHDLRSPFTTILGMAEMLKASLTSKGNDKTNELSDGILKASKYAYNTLENLLQWAQLQTGRLSSHPKWLNVNLIIQLTIDIASLQASEKNIKIEFSKDKDFVAYLDEVMFDTIIRNLINNSIKFSHVGGIIIIEAKANKEGFEFRITDNGTGISEETINNIFNERNSNSTLGTKGEMGTGIGLRVVNEFVNFNKSTWEIKSKINQGTSIKIQFNVNVENLNVLSNQFIESTPVSNNENDLDSIQLNTLDENKLAYLKGKQILIVDDQDEIRKVLRYQLIDKVDIIEASNGKEALYIAVEILPDLIISDVVMPEMGGIEFAKKIKSNVNTAHIPIILLTSQQEQKDLILGLESGVDDYLLKPVNYSILFLKIINLLQNREKTKKKFSLNDESLIESMKIDSLDKKFFDKVLLLIQDNISNEDFSVEKISYEIGMHRSNLTKKITALTGLTPNELIKVQRMKYAAKLLLSSGKNVSEVSYEVGYSDPKYFSKSFKKYYGVLPTDYKKGFNKD